MSTLVSAVYVLQNPGMAGMMEMGQLIKRRREQLSMRIEDLADAIDRPSSFIWRLEKGRNANPPAPEELRGLARALQMSPNSLLLALGYLESGDRDEDRSELANVPADVRAALAGVRWDGVASAIVLNAINYGIPTIRDAMNAVPTEPPLDEGKLESGDTPPDEEGPTG